MDSFDYYNESEFTIEKFLFNSWSIFQLCFFKSWSLKYDYYYINQFTGKFNNLELPFNRILIFLHVCIKLLKKKRVQTPTENSSSKCDMILFTIKKAVSRLIQRIIWLKLGDVHKICMGNVLVMSQLRKRRKNKEVLLHELRRASCRPGGLSAIGYVHVSVIFFSTTLITTDSVSPTRQKHTHIWRVA